MRRFASSISVVVVLVACGSDADNPTSVPGGAAGSCATSCGSKKCDPQLGCVDCLVDGDCGSKFCVLGKCEACRTNADCSGTTPSCWPGDHECHGSCGQGTACPNNAKLCDSATGACAACRTDADCPSGDERHCLATTGRCVACATVADCGAGVRACTAAGRCAECLSNADCPATAAVCDLEELKCKAGCTSDAQCGGTKPKCDLRRSECVYCLGTSDCPPATPVCDEGKRCVQCKDKRDCPAGQECKDNVCR